ncbi:hypothetical protein HYZ41_04880 [archaeon]|nr:hypothetical protein [archaeon]
MTILKTKDFLLTNWNSENRNDGIYAWKKTIGRGNNAKPFLLPYLINLNEELAECMGLYLGDGKFTDDDLGHSNFTSKDFDLIKKMIKFFHDLGVKNSDITFTLSYNKKGLKQAKRNFRSITEKFRKQKSERHRFPAYSIQINGLIFRIFLKNFIMKSLFRIMNNTDLRKGFLRGYFAAEGWIGHNRKENYIVCVGFAYNPKTEVWLRDFCIECLNLEGVNSKIKIRHQEHNGQIIITNWENYYKMWKLGLFDVCKRKKNKFIEIFLDTKISCEINEGTRLKLFKGDQYKLAKALGTYQASISNMKTGSKRNMWPNIEQIKKLSKINEVPIEEVKTDVKRVRFGNLTILDANEELINDIFNLESLVS